MNEQKVVTSRVLLICLVLVVGTFIAFEQVRHNDFVHLDDNQYVTGNPNVNKGLSVDSVVWAFTSGHAANWHPLTWLSHMADCQLYGLNPAGHHITSLLLHILNVLLLFLVFTRMTGAIWPSALVAALFALHPLRVESVAWIAERKDVLSGFFWMLTMIVYVRYTERSGMFRYLWVVLMFCLGLMAKPMVVTLPCVLLLLDYWPLERFKNVSIRRLFGEKVPLFILAAGSGVITFFVQQKGGAVSLLESISLSSRIGNALVSYVGYISKMLYPNRLAVLYPYPSDGTGFWFPAGGVIMLLFVLVGVIFVFRKRRYLVAGWLWYLGTLIPVIGFVQVGLQSMADRYTYIPLIGISIMIVWGLSDLFAKWHFRKVLPAALAGMVLIALLVSTRIQTRYWRNSITLYEHTLAVTENNHWIHYNLGAVFSNLGKREQAIDHYQQSLRINSDHAGAHYNLGNAIASLGKLDQAIDHYQQSLRINPDHAGAHNNLGIALASLGKHDQAIDHYQQSLRINPDGAGAHYNLGKALASLGKREQAIDHYRQALKWGPDFAGLHYNLGKALASLGKLEQAIDHYQQALKLEPDDLQVHSNVAYVLFMQKKVASAIVHWKKAIRLKPNWSNPKNSLAWALATVEDENIRDPAEAVRLAKRACDLTQYSQPDFLDTLAVAYAATGDFPKAIEIAKKALPLIVDNEELTHEIQERLELYKANKPYYNTQTDRFIP